MLLPAAFASIEKMTEEEEKKLMERLSEEELKKIEGAHAVNFPYHQGYWVAVAFTVLVGATALWAWTRW